MRTIEIRVNVNLDEIVCIKDGNIERSFSGRQLKAALAVREAIESKVAAINIIKSLSALDLMGSKMLFDACAEINVNASNYNN